MEKNKTFYRFITIFGPHKTRKSIKIGLDVIAERFLYLKKKIQKHILKQASVI